MVGRSSLLAWNVITRPSMKTAMAMVDTNLVRLLRASAASRNSRPRITSSSMKYFGEIEHRDGDDDIADRGENGAAGVLPGRDADVGDLDNAIDDERERQCHQHQARGRKGKAREPFHEFFGIHGSVNGRGTDKFPKTHRCGFMRIPAAAR